MCLTFRSFKSFIPSIFLLLAFCTLANLASASETGESVVLSWDRNPEPDIAGYRVRFGRTSGSLDEARDTFASVTELPISDLTPGNTYYFAVLAYNWAGYESPLSDEVSYMVPPIVAKPTLVPELNVKSSVAGYLTNGQNLGPAVSAPMGTGVGMGTVILRNRGMADLADLALSIDGPAAASFSATRLGSSTLAPGGILAINLTFAPKSMGALTATLHVTSKDPTNPSFDIPLSGIGLGVPRFAIVYGTGPELIRGQAVDFGRLNLWTNTVVKSFTIRNWGTATLTGLSATATGSAASDFQVGSLDNDPLPPGASRNFQITFTPTSDGVLSATLRLTSNDPFAQTFEIALNGSRIPRPQTGVGNPGGKEILDDSAVMGFSRETSNGSVALGSPNPAVEFGELSLTAKKRGQTVTLSNLGSGTLTNLRFTPVGSQSADFEITSPQSNSLAPGASMRFRVFFSPRAAGLRTATIAVSSDTGTRAFNVTGNGIAAPEIEVRLGRRKLNPAKAYVDLGRGQIGEKGFTRTLIITNVGSAKLKNLALVEAGISPDEFSISRVHAKSLAPGKSARFTITFRAGKGGIRWADLRISSNDPTTKSFDILLTGTGTSSKVTRKAKPAKSRNSDTSTTAAWIAPSPLANHPAIGIEVTAGRKYRTLTISRTPESPVTAADIQVSSDRVDWFSGTRHTTVLRDDSGVLKIRDNTPMTQDRKRFIRLKP